MSNPNFQENKQGLGLSRKLSPLLESAASDDLSAFIHQIEENPFGINEFSFWYCRKLGSKQMGFEQRSPLMIAATYGSLDVVNYIIGSGKVDVNEKSGTDSATPLHCAAAGCSDSSIEVIKILLAASGDSNCVDINGKRPCDVIPLNGKFMGLSKRKQLEILLGGFEGVETEIPQCVEKECVSEVVLPDMNVGVYGSDEFRMYSFKVKPCSRAYTHDWTECPFVHPGENARRRDLSKYSYSCVPCLEFKKGSCVKGDECEYAHGVFESWLHPAQYKTRLCKDEVGCGRKVCFFAHKKEELRPVYASTGSAMPSSNVPSTPPPGTPVVACSSPMSGNSWQNNVTRSPPKMQLQSSRLKAGLNAREIELERELLGLDSVRIQQHRQQKFENFASMSAKPMWNNNRFGDMNGTNLDDVFGSVDSSYLSPRMQSPTAHQLRSQNMNQQIRSSHMSNMMSSPSREVPAHAFDSSAAVMNARSSAFESRSHSFIDRGAVSHPPPGFTSSAANSTTMMSSKLSDWSSSGGKPDWGYQGDDLHKLTKSMSFGFPRANSANSNPNMTPYVADEPDVSWVNSLVKDASSLGAGVYTTKQRHGLEGVHEMLPLWAKA
ncbi:hypothetical protein DCAR_0728503 [Daucus carota subsp. sativus]|uniref:Uncharacterized protein n=2 Tax=Daucus carota subsp. sativus TaxID=79200 RepID=A0A164TMB8_DAUCS|nr:PREDICTED: zinc finger CCCH domain-containing protein 29-like [Daucus carota subsp. sativus]WOH09050.1 hypothetical protein DCAR_0728503 [Daucus carota subsp. sativus]